MTECLLEVDVRDDGCFDDGAGDEVPEDDGDVDMLEAESFRLVASI